MGRHDESRSTDRSPMECATRSNQAACQAKNSETLALPSPPYACAQLAVSDPDAASRRQARKRNGRHGLNALHDQMRKIADMTPYSDSFTTARFTSAQIVGVEQTWIVESGLHAAAIAHKAKGRLSSIPE